MKHSFFLFPLFFCVALFLTGILDPGRAPAADWTAGKQRVQMVPLEMEKLTEKMTDVKTLINVSDVILLGTPAGPPQSRPTGRRIGNGRLVIYFQPFDVKKMMKGSPMDRFHLVRPGILPYPPVEDPLNRLYPGPLADQVDYVLFLKHLREDQYYVVGVWQGVYPLGPDRKTIALLDEGFTALHDLTVEELARKIKTIAEE